MTETWKPNEEFKDWQFPAGFRGSFDYVRTGHPTIDGPRTYTAQIVNTNHENTAFHVTLHVAGTLAAWWTTIREVHVTKMGSAGGKSADVQAVERAIQRWASTGAIRGEARNIVVEDFDNE